MSFTNVFTELRPRLKPYPGHFRRLVTSLLRNLARLLALRLRAWLTGRKLIVILPHPYSHVGTPPVQLSGKAEKSLLVPGRGPRFRLFFPLTGRLLPRQVSSSRFPA